MMTRKASVIGMCIAVCVALIMVGCGGGDSEGGGSSGKAKRTGITEDMYVEYTARAFVYNIDLLGKQKKGEISIVDVANLAEKHAKELEKEYGYTHDEITKWGDKVNEEDSDRFIKITRRMMKRSGELGAN